MIKLGFDIDGCIANVSDPILKIIKERYNKETTELVISRYKFEECFDLSADKVWEIIEEVIMTPELIEPYEDSIDFLKYYFYETNKPLIFISARLEKFQEVIERWLKIHIPDIPFSLYNIGSDKMKPAWVDYMKINYFVEDRLENAKSIVEETNSSVILLDRDWNKSDFIFKIVRLNSWRDVKLFYITLRKVRMNASILNS